MKKSETEEMIKNDKLDDSIKTPASAKTEFKYHEMDISEVLLDNLTTNINNKLSSIDLVKLYNDVLLDKLDYYNDVENTLFEVIQLFWIKCRHFGFVQHMGHLMYVYDMILKNKINKYLILDLIVYMVNIEFNLPKKKSFDGMYI